MTESVRKQARLTPKLGGLGLRRTVDHADFSFRASWHEAKATAQEDWDRRQGSLKCTSHKQRHRSLSLREQEIESSDEKMYVFFICQKNRNGIHQENITHNVGFDEQKFFFFERGSDRTWPVSKSGRHKVHRKKNKHNKEHTIFSHQNNQNKALSSDRNNTKWHRSTKPQSFFVR